MKAFLIFILIFSADFAHAGYFFEPYLGLKTETIKLTDLASATTVINSSNIPTLGLKFGYRSLMGIDLNLAAETTAGQATVSNQTDKIKFSHAMGVIQLGVNALGPVKMYLGSSFQNDFTLDDSSGLQGFKLSGPSYQAGLQLKLFQQLHLGLQYNLHQFSTITGPNYAANNKLETFFLKNDSQDYTIYLSTSF